MVDFIWHQCQNKKGYKRYTYQKLKDELSEFDTCFPFMSAMEVVHWVRACHPNVSIHAYDSLRWLESLEFTLTREMGGFRPLLNSTDRSFSLINWQI